MMSGARAWQERVVPLTGSGLPGFLRLNPPTGNDELAVAGVDTRAAVQLLDRLVEPATETGALAAADRDRLLAALYRCLWGDQVTASHDCAACGSPYDLEFRLSALEASLSASREPAVAVGPRAIRDADDIVFQLPDAAAEDAAAAGGPAGLAAMAAAIADLPVDVLAGRLDVLAPIIDVDLAASCAECGHGASLRFDLQSFALQRLLDERERLLADVDVIARAYGWSLEAILGLERSLRQGFAQRLRDSA
jgi:hypothetical protein